MRPSTLRGVAPASILLVPGIDSSIEHIARLEAKVRVQADELARCGDRLAVAATYRALCEERLQQLAPGHPIPIREEDITLHKNSESGCNGVNGTNGAAAAAVAMRRERECEQQNFALRRRVAALDAERSIHHSKS